MSGNDRNKRRSLIMERVRDYVKGKINFYETKEEDEGTRINLFIFCDRTT